MISFTTSLCYDIYCFQEVVRRKDFAMHTLPLNKEEIAFKAEYIKKHQGDSTTYDIKEIQTLLNEAFNSKGNSTGAFSEENFIPAELDCSFIRHPRYMPAFLHSHEFFEIVYVKHGNCINYINGETVTLNEGDFCFHSPGTVHALLVFSDDDIAYNIVIRHSTFAQYFLGLFSEADILSQFFAHVIYHSDEFPYLIFHAGADMELDGIIEKAEGIYSSEGRFKKQLLNAILAEFFAMLLRNHEKDVYVPTTSKQVDDNLVFILHYMEEHFASVTLKELSDFFGYSERQLQRIIKKATGKTFMENIQLHRIKQAENLLQKSDLSVEQIALEVGYSSTNNFRRIFQKITGCMPNEYRKQ